jgi:peptide/nickel transport system permease protein
MTIETRAGRTPRDKALTAEMAEERIYVASQTRLMWWKFRRHKMAVASVVLVIILYLGAIFAEFVAPYDPNETDTKFLFVPPRAVRFWGPDGPSLRPFVYGLKVHVDDESYRTTWTEDSAVQQPIHFFVHGYSYKMWGLVQSDIHLFGLKDGQKAVFLLGTDKLGQDILSRIIFGSRVSLSIGLVGISISLVLGITIGGVSGFYGGFVDILVQRVIEFIRSIPDIPLWMSLSAALPTDIPPLARYFGITVILSFIGWTGLARVVRGSFLALREQDFVLAATLAGASEWRVIMRHMVPSFMSYLIASTTLAIPGMILGETSLSFLGLGLRPPVVSWGVMLKDAQRLRFVAEAPWLLLPGIFVVVTVLSFNFVGDGLRDAVDPYAR